MTVLVILGGIALTLEKVCLFFFQVFIHVYSRHAATHDRKQFQCLNIVEK